MQFFTKLKLLVFKEKPLTPHTLYFSFLSRVNIMMGNDDWELLWEFGWEYKILTENRPTVSFWFPNSETFITFYFIVFNVRHSDLEERVLRKVWSLSPAQSKYYHLSGTGWWWPGGRRENVKSVAAHSLTACAGGGGLGKDELDDKWSKLNSNLKQVTA